MAPIESDDDSSAMDEDDELQDLRAGSENDADRLQPLFRAGATDAEGWTQLMDDKICQRMLSEGTGNSPQMNQDVRCSYSVWLDNDSSGTILQHYRDMRYRIGEAEAVPMLELGLRHMREGAECELSGDSAWAWGAAGLRAAGAGEGDVPPDARVRMKVTLHECLPMPSSELSWNDKVQEVSWRKANGNDHFKRGQYLKARKCYLAAAEVFAGDFNPPEHVVKGTPAAGCAAASLVADCAANLAAVHLEMDEPSEAKAAASDALEVSPRHVKALFRLAKACLMLDEYKECESALKRALAIEPENESIKKVQFELARKKQQYSVRSKQMAERLFSGLHDERGSSRSAKPEKEWEQLGVLGACRAMIWDSRLYIGLAAVMVLAFLALLAILPARHWKFLFMIFLIGGPLTLAIISAINAEDNGDAKLAKKRR